MTRYAEKIEKMYIWHGPDACPEWVVYDPAKHTDGQRLYTEQERLEIIKQHEKCFFFVFGIVGILAIGFILSCILLP